MKIVSLSLNYTNPLKGTSVFKSADNKYKNMIWDSPNHPFT